MFVSLTFAIGFYGVPSWAVASFQSGGVVVFLIVE